MIVGRDEPQRQTMTRLLEADGHEVRIAAACGEALRLYAKLQPELVIMDVALNDGDGFLCTQRLRSLAGERLAPVILATPIEDAATLQRFIDCGATDFLADPTDALALRAKINGHAQALGVYRHLERLSEKFHEEIRFAKHMFDAVLGRSPGVSCLQHWTLTAGHFCGDLLIHATTPDGRLHLLLGDFTGHGLAAAVGALPASEVFFAMSRKGCAIGEIAAEMNRKLHALLPTGQFCAATLVSVDVVDGHLEAWIGGQPPPMLCDGGRRLVAELPSRHLPLGILAPEEFDASTQTLAVGDYDHLLLYSDGLIEARNPAGDVFGAHRLVEALASPARRQGLLQRIKSRLIAFLDGLEPHDDVSVLLVKLDPTV
ncbi:MAG: fused response regulator/phosphatase [Rhodocyclaceae bacterium]|nr:fused response regulator/phosphatase [Rhodocyclaceae bacterium]